MAFQAGSYDIIVIGAGHAGCEAALAGARLGQRTLLLTLSLESIGLMPCNPSIGGTGKGHLVREIDALGGQMALVTDKTTIQSRMLNLSKGPAVYSLRAQTDKALYHLEMKKTLENQENLSIVMDEAVHIEIEEGKVQGVRTRLEAFYQAQAVILAAGVYLESAIHIGSCIIPSGPLGLSSSQYLAASLRQAGLPLRRFKTGTPARVHGASMDFSKMTVQEGDVPIVPFSFLTERIDTKQALCYLTRTTQETHRIIHDNLSRSARFSGQMNSEGARYCPSVEDKVMRFPDKENHQFFVEPEGKDTQEYYIQGFSSSMDYEIQLQMYHSVPGLENAQLMRPAYAIEYECLDPLCLTSALEVRGIQGLYSAGQLNGTSGYEEAAAQGLIAGINAALSLKGQPPFIPDRSNSYIGVLIDDLVTKGTNEPYRMMTSRCEYRLLLRQDNADLRLTPYGRAIGLVSDARYARFLERKQAIEAEMERLQKLRITPAVSQPVLAAQGMAALVKTISAFEFFRRPEASYAFLEQMGYAVPLLPKDVLEQCLIQARYQGYIEKQQAQVEAFQKLESKKLSPAICYQDIRGLRLEARQKLDAQKPASIGQASRISGVSPADISVLLIHLHKTTQEDPRL